MDIDILKRATAKLDSFLTDISELLHEDQVTSEEKEALTTILDVTGSVLLKLLNDVKSLVGEEIDFLQDLDLYDDQIFDSPWDLSEEIDPLNSMINIGNDDDL